MDNQEPTMPVSATCPAYDYAMRSLPPDTCSYWGIPILARAFLRHQMEKAYTAGVESVTKKEDVQPSDSEPTHA